MLYKARHWRAFHGYGAFFGANKQVAFYALIRAENGFFVQKDASYANTVIPD